MRRTAYVSLVLFMCTATLGCFVSHREEVRETRVPAVERHTTVETMPGAAETTVETRY